MISNRFGYRSFHSSSISLKYSLRTRMDSIVLWNKIQLRTRIPIVSPIFHARVVCGRHQINGNARGPTQQTAMIINDFRKNHEIFSSAERGGLETSGNSPQCLHFFAASCISSPQKGHFLIITSHDKRLIRPPK